MQNIKQLHIRLSLGFRDELMGENGNYIVIEVKAGLQGYSQHLVAKSCNSDKPEVGLTQLVS